MAKWTSRLVALSAVTLTSFVAIVYLVRRYIFQESTSSDGVTNQENLSQLTTRQEIGQGDTLENTMPSHTNSLSHEQTSKQIQSSDTNSDEQTVKLTTSTDMRSLLSQVKLKDMGVSIDESLIVEFDSDEELTSTVEVIELDSSSYQYKTFSGAVNDSFLDDPNDVTANDDDESEISSSTDSAEFDESTLKSSGWDRDESAISGFKNSVLDDSLIRNSSLLNTSEYTAAIVDEMKTSTLTTISPLPEDCVTISDDDDDHNENGITHEQPIIDTAQLPKSESPDYIESRINSINIHPCEIHDDTDVTNTPTDEDNLNRSSASFNKNYSVDDDNIGSATDSNDDAESNADLSDESLNITETINEVEANISNKCKLEESRDDVIILDDSRDDRFDDSHDVIILDDTQDDNIDDKNDDTETDKLNDSGDVIEINSSIESIDESTNNVPHVNVKDESQIKDEPYVSKTCDESNVNTESNIGDDTKLDDESYVNDLDSTINESKLDDESNVNEELNLNGEPNHNVSNTNESKETKLNLNDSDSFEVSEENSSNVSINQMSEASVSTDISALDSTVMYNNNYSMQNSQPITESNSVTSLDDENNVIKFDSNTDINELYENLIPDSKSTIHQKTDNENLSTVIHESVAKFVSIEPPKTVVMEVDNYSSSDFEEALRIASESPSRVDQKCCDVIVSLLRHDDVAMTTRVLGLIMNCAAYTGNHDKLLDAGCLSEFSRLLSIQKVAASPDSKVLTALCPAINNLAMNDRNISHMAEIVQHLIEITVSPMTPDPFKLSTLQPLTNLCVLDTHHQLYTPLAHTLYRLVGSGDSSLQLPSLRVLVNLSCNEVMVAHLLAAKTPTTHCTVYTPVIHTLYRLVDSGDSSLQLPSLRVLVNLSCNEVMVAHLLAAKTLYTPVIHTLYRLVDSGDSSLQLPSLRVLVNLSCNEVMVAHLLAAKAPECSLELLAPTCDLDLLLRWTTLLSHLTTATLTHHILPASLPITDKAASPETMYSFLYGVNSVGLVKTRAFILSSHGNEDIRNQATKIYSGLSRTTVV